ncbi:MAG: glycosyltransferase family 39 protein [Candidatus Sulfotelmatobacter sp.]
MASPTESLPNNRSHFLPCVLLALALLASLFPFSGKAFNVDDTLFVYVARQITQHPLDPFGIRINWYLDAVPMAYETKNPPLASYYIAAVAGVVGWSERALHFAFLLPALAVVLGTYRLAQRFTKSPLWAAAATLLAPAFLASASSVMCDTMMLALWLWAIIFWIEGLGSEALGSEALEPQEPRYLAVSALLITLCALTKFLGIALILLLPAYSWMRQRRFGSWAWYLLLPILVLTGFQHWTKAVYGLRMITGAAHFSTGMRQERQTSLLAKALVDLSFVGGCALPALTFAPIIWPRRKILAVCVVSAIAAFLIGTGRIGLGEILGPPRFYRHWLLVGIQLTVFVAAGFSIMALAAADAWKHKDADALLLALWVFGAYIFTGFVNWTINARSVLPLTPAVGILLARRIEALPALSTRWRTAMLAIPLAVAGAISLWLTWADTEMANAARTAAMAIEEKTRNQPGSVWFMGHWGFQYYMESFGATAVVINDPPRRPGDYLAVDKNGLLLLEMRPEFVASRDVIQIPMPLGITTAQNTLGAGFYSSDLGPLPFAIGPVPPQRYDLIRLGANRVSATAFPKDSLEVTPSH